MKNVLAAILIAFFAYLIIAETVKIVFWVWFAYETIDTMQSHVFVWGGMVAVLSFLGSYFLLKDEDG